VKREAELKAIAMQELKRQRPQYIIQSFSTLGSPDRSVTGSGMTTHWEFKHGTPDFDSPGVQELMCIRLALHGHCRYVIWQEAPTGKMARTMIVHPRAVHARIGWALDPEAFCIGYNPRWLIEQIVKTHEIPVDFVKNSHV
jgi:hypothetical protein